MKSKLTRIITYIIICVAMPAMLQSCKVNNGDIGLLYGTWFISSMEVDGQPYDGWRTDDNEDTFFQFQNNICFITWVDEHHQAESRVCTWQWVEDQTVIELNFTHTDDRFPEPVPDGYLYGAPSRLLLTQPGIYRFDVVWKDDKHTVWTTVNTEGQRLTYHLQQTW